MLSKETPYIKLPIVICLLSQLALLSCRQNPISTASLPKLKVYSQQQSVAQVPETVADANKTFPPDEHYSITVNNVPVRDVLFTLARDAKLNLDLDHSVNGTLTLNIVEQPLQVILNRIAKQAKLRYQLDNGALQFFADTPYLQAYRIDYLNTTRQSHSDASLSIALGTSSHQETQTGISHANHSSTRISNQADNTFWETLEANLMAILADVGSTLTKDNTAHVIINRSAGLALVKATAKQHTVIAAYIDNVVSSSRRQVLIEATVMEVNLNKHFSAGIDWQRLTHGNGWEVTQNLTRPSLASAGEQFQITYLDSQRRHSLTSTLRILEQFGRVKVLSKPKVMALNNQPSILKVVDNRVYFTLEVDNTTASGGATTTTIETRIHTVPVGFTMTVTPFISDTNSVMLNIRPTISRILRFVNDPNPALAEHNIVSPVPEIQVREIETVLHLEDGQIAMIGGLMQESISQNKNQVPGLSKLPWLGHLFKGKEKTRSKSELVIFLQPIKIP